MENSLPATEARSTSSKLRAVILPLGLKEEKRQASCSAVGLALDKLILTKLGNALLKRNTLVYPAYKSFKLCEFIFDAFLVASFL